MVAGDPTLRSQGYRGGAYTIYRCCSNGPFDPNPIGVVDTDTQELPKQYCPGGIRVNMDFPKSA